MKLLLDRGTPRSATAILRKADFDAVHTGEVGLAEAEDSEIIYRARLENRIVITYDADFHMLLALDKAKMPSVIRIRIEGLRADDFGELIQNVLAQCSAELNDGAMISVNNFQIRIRRLPLS
jgi:predicted nuclease of predicted toxin-antitoxin system